MGFCVVLMSDCVRLGAAVHGRSCNLRETILSCLCCSGGALVKCMSGITTPQSAMPTSTPKSLPGLPAFGPLRTPASRELT
jgi:hypothetical protein